MSYFAGMLLVVVQQGICPQIGPATVEIGSVDRPNEAFSRVASVAIDSSERVYILDSQEKTVSVFTRDGEWVTRFGSPGPGPGEFMNPGQLGILGDTVWVADAALQRTTFFSREGKVLGTYRSAYSGAEFSIAGAFPLRSGNAIGVVSRRSGQDGPMPITKVQLETDSVAVIGYMEAGRNVLRLPSSRPGGRYLYMSNPVPSGAILTVLPEDNAVLVTERPAETNRYRITKMTEVGDTVFSRSVPYTPVPISRRERETIVESVTAVVGKDVRFTREQWIEVLALKGNYSPVSGVVPATGGRVWIILRQPKGVAPLLQLIGTDGQPVCTVRLPDTATVAAASDATIWGLQTDEWGVPYVVSFPLSFHER